MSSVIISGDTSGTISLTAPAVSGTTVLTLPTTNGTIITTATGQTLTSPTITGAVVSSMASSVITSNTAQATTSGTSVTFSSIPSQVKRITVMFNGVSTSGSSDVIVQLGSGSTTTTGYLCQKIYSTGTSINNATATNCISGLVTNNASDTKYGHSVITNVSGNIWVATSSDTSYNSMFGWSAGGITLGGTLDRVVITTANGTDTFDAGSINILYE